MKTCIRNIIDYLYLFAKKQIKYKYIQALIDSGFLVIGKKTYGYQYLEIDSYTGSERKVIIGNYTSLSKNLRIITGGMHPYNWVSLFPFRINYSLEGAYSDGTPTTNGDIIIGSDVWLGTNVTVLSGVKIGDGAVIAANSLVNKDIPPYSIAGGVPAKIIKYRFSENHVKALLKIKWWDWDEDKILSNVDLLSSDKIDEFIDKNHVK